MAKKFGLVDEIGDLNKAINIAKEISKSPKANLYRVKREKSFVEKLFGEKTEAIFNSLSSILEGNVEKVNLMYILD